MIFLGKMREIDPQKDRGVWQFLQDHMTHPLVLTGDSYNTDSDVIKFTDPHTWETGYKIVEFDGSELKRVQPNCNDKSQERIKEV